MEHKIKSSVYRLIRKQHKNGYNLDEVSEKTGIPLDRLGDIEREQKEPDLDDIVQLSKIYDSKRLCRWFCSNKCPVGKCIELQPIDGLERESFYKIMVQILNSINKIKEIDVDRMLDIIEDGKIDPDELDEFDELKKHLKKISQNYGALIRWEEDGDSTLDETFK